MQNIDIFSIKNRKSDVTNVSGLQSLTHKTMLLEMSLPKINIIANTFEPKLKNLIKADGDQTDISPETERISKRQNQRIDMFKNEIVKGQKTHKITFRDQIAGQSLHQIKYNSIQIFYLSYFHKEPEEDLDECCPCNIF